MASVEQAEKGEASVAVQATAVRGAPAGTAPAQLGAARAPAGAPSGGPASAPSKPRREGPAGLPLNEGTPGYIRSAFVRKVYGLLSVQLAMTAAIGWAVNRLVEAHPEVRWPLFGASFGVLVCTFCCMACRSRLTTVFPYNYATLGVVTVAMSILVGITTARYNTTSVIIAMASTAAVFTCLTVYACLTKTDWTGIGLYLGTGLLALIVVGSVMSLFCWCGLCPGTVVQKLFAIFGVIIFAIFIIYDTQKILGGRGLVQYTIDDYAEATLDLYLDLINMFIYILSLLGSGSD